MDDKHKTRRISTLISILISAFFAAVGIAGFQRTQDVTQLLLFLGAAALSYLIVQFLFKGVNKLLDSIDDK